MPLAVGTGLWIGFGVLYFILLVWLGIMSLRKGHWVMFLLGIPLPIFWVIGALMPPSEEAVKSTEYKPEHGGEG